MKKEVRQIPVGTIRIQASDLNVYEKTKRSWRLCKKKFPEILRVIELFKGEKKFKVLIDKKNPRFLKGQLSVEGLPQGARINVLPSGEVLDKAYSLFAPCLTIHDEYSDDHWDVLYQNKGGTFSYVYTLDKKSKARKRKYKKVDQFAKCYDGLRKQIVRGLRNENDFLAVPMYTLLKTYMRVGNERYYQKNGNQGLTTLQKRNVRIQGKEVVFSYVGKDGVPLKLKGKFPQSYLVRLTKLLKEKRRKDFIFTLDDSRPLPERYFKQGFKRYCGKEFYPHIVRSHYATTKVKGFLEQKKKASKEEVQDLFLQIATKLGHKRFNKKEQEWQENYSVTVNHYIRPELVRRVKRLYKS